MAASKCGGVAFPLYSKRMKYSSYVTPTQCCRGCLYVNLIRGFLVSHHPQVAFLYCYWQIKYGRDIYFTHDLPPNDSQYRFVWIFSCQKFPNCHRRRRRRRGCCQCEAFVSNSFCSSSSFVLFCSRYGVAVLRQFNDNFAEQRKTRTRKLFLNKE